MSMTRDQLENRMIDYLYEELDASERAAFEEGLREHPDLQAEVTRLGETRASFSGLEEIEVPHLVKANILREARLAIAEDKRNWFERIANALMRPGVATAFVAVLVAGVGLFVVDRGGVFYHEEQVTVSPAEDMSATAAKERKDLLAEASAPDPTEGLPGGGDLPAARAEKEVMDDAPVGMGLETGLAEASEERSLGGAGARPLRKDRETSLKLASTDSERTSSTITKGAKNVKTANKSKKRMAKKTPLKQGEKKDFPESRKRQVQQEVKRRSKQDGLFGAAPSLAEEDLSFGADQKRPMTTQSAEPEPQPYVAPAPATVQTSKSPTAPLEKHHPAPGSTKRALNEGLSTVQADESPAQSAEVPADADFLEDEFSSLRRELKGQRSRSAVRAYVSYLKDHPDSRTLSALREAIEVALEAKALAEAEWLLQQLEKRGGSKKSLSAYRERLRKAKGEKAKPTQKKNAK